jgi:hypothetical protein
VIENGIRWAAPSKDIATPEFGNRKDGWMTAGK